ncbi:MAG: hypothetical protein KatS3mg065_0200 [Chloroflexota bacterium]|nr:MAG: hypothetical protein KatS3mg065_0200 [Chloroflexota bacterium]
MAGATTAGTGEAGRPAGTIVPKPWGHELIWAHTDRYVGKILVIEAGKRLSLQYHERKDEAIYVISGRLRLHLGEEGGAVRAEELGPGEFRHIPPGASTATKRSSGSSSARSRRRSSTTSSASRTTTAARGRAPRRF